MNSERGLKGFILSRFFLTLAVTGIVEVFFINLANRFLIPSVIKFTGFEKLVHIDSISGLFLVVFVLGAMWVLGRLLPFFKVSTAEATAFLMSELIKHGLGSSDIAEATQTIEDLSRNPKAIIVLLISMIVILVIMLLPYIAAGVFFSVSVAKEIRHIQREKEIARRKEEERRYLMISNIVHDLKTPMTTVYGYAKALNDGIVPEAKRPEYFEAIMAKSDRMNEVVALLLDYVKLDSEGFTIKKERLDICELLRSCCAFSYTDVESAGDEIEIDIPDKPLFISADGIQLSRVITNLITNAIRHNPKGTRIRVSLTCESFSTAEDIRIFVADSGDEIPSPLCDQIFDPFVTGDESRASGSGTGLGLALSTKICDMHGYGFKLVQRPEILRYRLGDEYKKVFVISI